MLGFDTITSYTARDTAFLVETEHFRARLDGAAVAEEFALRVTSIFRREEGYWKLVHRHADPAARPQSRRSLAQSAGPGCRQTADRPSGFRQGPRAHLACEAFPAACLPG